MSSPASQFCRMSLKAKPIATELTPRPAIRSPGFNDGIMIVAARRKPSSKMAAFANPPSTVPRFSRWRRPDWRTMEGSGEERQAVEDRQHDEGDDDVRQQPGGAVHPAIDAFARPAQAEINLLRCVLCLSDENHGLNQVDPWQIRFVDRTGSVVIRSQSRQQQKSAFLAVEEVIAHLATLRDPF